MSSLADVYAFMGQMVQRIFVGGVPREEERSFFELSKQIGRAVMKEQRIQDPCVARKLPQDTILGVASQELFNKMKALFAE